MGDFENMMDKIKRTITIFLTLLTVLVMLPCMTVDAIQFTPPFELNSQAGILVNLDTNTVIFQKNADTPMSPAQTVNIMTAILCLENCSDLENTMVTMPAEIYNDFDTYRQNDPNIYVTTADFYMGEELSMLTLMYGMMLQSGCEAASAIAYTIGNGSVSTFVNMMNEKAKQIGATNTNFTNPHGLYAETQYTTAEDLAKITEYALSLPRFEEIATAMTYEVQPTNVHTQAYELTHSNIMMDSDSEYYYDGVKGIKTGNSTQSGRCLVTEYKKNGSNYLLVLLNAPMKDPDGRNRFYHLEDAKQLIAWAAEHIKYTTLLEGDKEIDEVEVDYASGNGYVLVKPETSYSTLWLDTMDTTTIQRVPKYNEHIYAPVKKGDILGTMTLSVGGEELTTVNLVATSDVERSFVNYNMAVLQDFPKSKWFKIAVLVGTVGAVLYVVFYVVRVREYNLNRRRSKKPINKEPKS